MNFEYILSSCRYCRLQLIQFHSNLATNISRSIIKQLRPCSSFFFSFIRFYSSVNRHLYSADDEDGSHLNGACISIKSNKVKAWYGERERAREREKKKSFKQKWYENWFGVNGKHLKWSKNQTIEPSQILNWDLTTIAPTSVPNFQLHVIWLNGFIFLLDKISLFFAFWHCVWVLP